MTQRAQASKFHSVPIFNDGNVHFNVSDTQTGETLLIHRFLASDHRHPSYPAYQAAQRAVAVALADALNAAGDEAIERIIAAKAAIQRDFFPECAA